MAILSAHRIAGAALLRPRMRRRRRLGTLRVAHAHFPTVIPLQSSRRSARPRPRTNRRRKPSKHSIPTLPTVRERWGVPWASSQQFSCGFGF
ncbi:hypothetical protein ANCDUO_11596 [Ancylostoma duodenale]|uniref:Uncharacterized protein n=1 Tax=Ancylostoma duodenale TaxID=51022 RepID=A0A0C2GH56_9BILA|nr:hypothetical protein ANCDUO_11596 [Ancylostoma duodenale]